MPRRDRDGHLAACSWKEKKYNNVYSRTEKEGNGTNAEIKPERARHETVNRKGRRLCYIQSKIRFYLIYFLFELGLLFLFNLFRLEEIYLS